MNLSRRGLLASSLAAPMISLPYAGLTKEPFKITTYKDFGYDIPWYDCEGVRFTARTILLEGNNGKTRSYVVIDKSMIDLHQPYEKSFINSEVDIHIEGMMHQHYNS